MSSPCAKRKVKTLGISFPQLFYLFIILSNGVAAQTGDVTVTSVNVGAIIDVSSRIGREQKIAMKIAAERFNNGSNTHELILHFQDSGRNPYIAASAAEVLLKEQKVQAIIGMETWQEAATVADHVKNQSQVVPVISFAAPSTTPPLIQHRWPFLIRMTSDGSNQMECIASIVAAYNWKRVVVIYEDDGYGGDVGLLSLLSKALQDTNSKIENYLVLPQVLLSESNQSWDELEELLKLPTLKSQVFIVLQSSLPTVTNLFRVAKKMGLVGRDSAWIIAETITSLLDPQDNFDMEGTLGIKTHYDSKSKSYSDFQMQFQARNTEESNSKPGIYALRAYDTIMILSQAIESNNTSTVLQGGYEGLSGNMRLKDGEAQVNSTIFRILNVVDGKMDRELNFWTPEVGFSEPIDKNRSGNVGKVIWPGKITRTPKGLGMPSSEKPMIIGVPGETTFGKFVIVDKRDNQEENVYDGFCIQIFYKVLDRLNYSLSYEFQVHDGTYDELVEKVYNKTYDAAVGDITVIAERMKKVDFTQPYMGSGLSMIVPQVPDKVPTWLFTKPFTWHMWMVTAATLPYTMLTLWFLEPPHSEFRPDSRMKQISTAIWFTFSSLFFSHKETVHSNLTRVVFIVWLSLVLIITSSYTANLTSMLTVQRMKPNVTDINMLVSTNAPVGLDNANDFVSKYMENVLKFKRENLIQMSEYSFKGNLSNEPISAAFLELPYAEVFLNKYCEGFTGITNGTNKYGGLSFAFRKGSPIAKDFSKAILELLESGELKILQKQWLSPVDECLKNSTSNQPESLRLNSFSGLFVISACTSTLCILLSRIKRKKINEGSASPSNENVKRRHLQKSISRVPTFASYVVGTTSRWDDYSRTSSSLEQPAAFIPAEIECIPIQQTESRV